MNICVTITACCDKVVLFVTAPICLFLNVVNLQIKGSVTATNATVASALNHDAGDNRFGDCHDAPLVTYYPRLYASISPSSTVLNGFPHDSTASSLVRASNGFSPTAISA